MEINDELREFLQIYFVEPQLLGSDETKTEEAKLREEGLKRIIQKMFIKHQILEFDSIKSILETQEGASELYEAISDKKGEDVARETFDNAIKEVQEFIAIQFGMAPRRKKEHEILAEKLEEKYGTGLIENNINRMIFKNIGTTGGDGCSGGGCGCG
ncbi:MAG: hypothetical protein AABY15_00135 [Nanoarchaeota archaeon]